MNPLDSDSDSDSPSPDDPLRPAIAGLPLPQTPAAILSKAQRLVLGRQLRRRAVLAASAAAVLLLGLLAGRPWSSSVEQNAIALDAETLDALFAPPPVDSLNELDRRMAVALHVLDPQEKSPQEKSQ